MCSKETHSLRVFTVILLAATSLSSVSTRGLKVILLTSGAFLFMAGVGVSITLLVVAPTLQPTSWAVRQYDANDMGGDWPPKFAIHVPDWVPNGTGDLHWWAPSAIFISVCLIP